MAPPIIVAVGSALIRTTAKQLPKILRRFKNAKEVKSPTSSQIDRAGNITKDLGNFSTKSRATLKKADTARPSVFESLTGTGRTAGQKAMRGVTTGEARRLITKGGAATVVAGATGYGLGRKKDKKADAAKPTKKTDTAKKNDPRKDKKKMAIPKTLPKPRPYRTNMKVGGRGTAAERLREIEKNKVLDKVKKAATKKGKGK
tara:strand:- start:230 stop:835 length:606 start_codon:yes stop_codon:yes gene_type:complete